MAREGLPPDAFEAHPKGPHLWLRLPEGWERLGFNARLRRQDGPAVVPSGAVAVGAGVIGPPEALPVSLGAAADRNRPRSALRLVAAALQEEAPAPFAEVV